MHELAHWSEVRTGWDHDKQGYALGELAAEIASCYVAAELGIPQGEGLGIAQVTTVTDSVVRGACAATEIPGSSTDLKLTSNAQDRSDVAPV